MPRQNRTDRSQVKVEAVPQSLADLNKAAACPPLSPNFSPMAYYRSIESMAHQATTYLDSSSTSTNTAHVQEQAYILLLKAATLAIQQLPKHPDFHTRLNAERRKMLDAQSKSILKQLSDLKPILKARRDRWERDKPPETEEAPPPPEAVFNIEPTPDPTVPAGEVTTVLKRRSAVKPPGSTSSLSGVATSSPALSRRSSITSSLSTQSLPYCPSVPSAPDLTHPSIPHLQRLPSAPDLDLYAALPAWTPPRRTHQPSHQFDSAHQSQQGFAPAAGSIVYPDLPHRPPKVEVSQQGRRPEPPPPAVIQKSGPTSVGLRQLQLPVSLIDSFVALAWSNTENKIETCGLLLGRLDGVANKLEVTALLVPRQKGLPDSCEMLDEEHIFQAQEERDLLTLGWIHTHPVQTCFLSSVDLHTHCAYQISLPEAIAVVCAPSHEPSVGIFRLTDPPGVGLIMECTEPGFHPHKAAALYTDADTPAGHVQKGTADHFEIIDLRPVHER